MEICGVSYCTYGEDAYCCGLFDQDCCYNFEWYSMWYVWVGIVVFVLLLSFAIKYCRQRQQLRLQHEVLREESSILVSHQYRQPPIQPAREVDAPPSYAQVQKSQTNQYSSYNSMNQANRPPTTLPPRYQE